MKKIFAIIISVLLFISMTVVSVGHDDITINIAFDNESQTFTISGHIDFIRDRIPVGLLISQGSEIVALADTLAVGKEEAGIPYTFSNVKLIPSTKTGYLTIVVATSEIDCVGQASYYYFGVDGKIIALNTLKAAIESRDYNTLKTAIINTKLDLGVDDSIFLNFSERAQKVAMNNLFGLVIADFSDFDVDNLTDEQCTQIDEQIKLYQKQYKEAIELGKFFDSHSSAALKEWYDSNKEAYSFLTDDNTTAFDETKLLDYFDRAALKENFTDRAENIEFVKSMKELNIEMKKQAVLQIVNDSNQSETLEIISNLTPLLSNVTDTNGQNPVSVNYADWGSFSENQKTSVSLNIAMKNYKSIYEFVNAINAEIVQVKNGLTFIPGSSNSLGNSSGGSGSKKGNSSVLMPVVTPQEEVKEKTSFKDIKNVEWAKEAISYLYSKNIVSGRNNDTFAPGDQVTRAELIKMLVLGFDLEGSKAVSFGDVSNNSWYAQYVSIAAANGLINGDENGNFNPNKPVSRQDAAVMMYRLVEKTAPKAQKAYFADYGEISSYAKKAVDYMCATGIINGVGDDKFAPHNNLTRAQSAKMVYGLLVH